MYPTIHSNSTGSSAGAYPPPQQAGPSNRDTRSYANGPAQLASASSIGSALPVLRVQIAEHLSVSPPVMISSETGNIPRTDYVQAFDFEHQILQDFSTEAETSTSIVVDESAALDVQRYEQLGHEREAVVMALLAVTTTEDRDSQVLKWLEDYSNLKSMGFSSETVTGALIAYPDDITEATEACLGAST